MLVFFREVLACDVCALIPRPPPIPRRIRTWDPIEETREGPERGRRAGRRAEEKKGTKRAEEKKRMDQNLIAG
ncbi:battenin [Platysternon megacephalum]|uniref:Battenin n=1 Tax=Platysternon megacephalum TaxID=55544 RepID=A0A4D9DJK3_9SAUR|nr:battenin [Platysternon megacephalum]